MNNLDILEERRMVLELFSEYETLLTPNQREVLADYYRFDLSLGEIASSSLISRAAVHDTIDKAVKKMKKYEEKLRLVEKKKDMKATVAAIEEVDDPTTKLELYQQLAKELTNGI